MAIRHFAAGAFTVAALASAVAFQADDIPPAPYEARSSRWPKVREAFLEANPVCAVCGSASDLNVHHVRPFHRNPDLELDPENLITLCRRHHFVLGHLESWTSWNETIQPDAARWKKRLAERP